MSVSGKIGEPLMKKPVTLKQLRYLAALADKLHFRNAAEAVGVSQPSLSTQISDLETSLRLRLVERGKGPVTLTAPGREVVARARRIVDEVQGLEDLATTLRDGVSGTLRMGSSLTIGPYFLPSMLRDLHAAHPDILLHIREGTPADLEVELLSGLHDVILTQMPVRSADVKTAVLFREPLLLVVPAHHALAQKEAINRHDLAGLRVLTLGPKYALNEQVRAICHDTGATLLEHYEGTSLDGLRQMVAMEMGVALMPALYVASEVTERDPSVTALPFQSRSHHRTLGLAWRKSSGRIATLELLEKAFRASIATAFTGTLIGMG